LTQQWIAGCGNWEDNYLVKMHPALFFSSHLRNISSTIIENIKTIVQNQPESGLAYFYFDINGKAKQTSESLLSSLVLSFTAKSGNYVFIEQLLGNMISYTSQQRMNSFIF
jgi:hypothetical protein